MKINLEQLMIDPLSGRPVEEGGRPMAVGLACYMALDIALDDDRSLEPATRYAMGKLQMLLLSQKSVELASEDIAMLKGRIGKIFKPWLIVQLWDILEGHAKEIES